MQTTTPPGHLASGPPDEAFWERYNRRLELPLSTVSSVLLHCVAAALAVWGLTGLAHSAPDKSAVPVMLTDVDGPDDMGEGSLGSGILTDPLRPTEPSSLSGSGGVIPDPTSLPAVAPAVRVLDDPSGTVPRAEATGNDFKALDEALRQKLPRVDADKKPGPGQGGTGADSSRARSLRWVLRFRTASGDDYVAQLAAMGAVVLVPLPPENKQCLYFTDLKNLGTRRMATDDDLKRLAEQIKFSDIRADSVRGVCEALGVKEEARSFWAFFPKGMEVELARKETGYRNRRPEDVQETVFRVVVRGGKHEIVVDDQTPK